MQRAALGLLYYKVIMLFFLIMEWWSQVALRQHYYKKKLVEVMKFQLGYFKSWKIMLKNAALNMSANLENLAVATGLEKVNFHSNPKER